MKVAAIDLGSNTFLCLVAEVIQNKIVNIYHDSVEIVRLGQGLDKNKSFHPDAIKRADDCLKKFHEIIIAQRPERVLAMATSAARDAENKEELFKLGLKYNIPIEIIPGEREAEITYQGSCSGLKVENKNLMVIDIGGGSTEYILGAGDKLILGKSFDMGCVRLTERFVTTQPTSLQEVNNVRSFVEDKLQQLKKLISTNLQIDELIAVAGTPTTLAAVEIGEFNVDKIDGHIFTKSKLVYWLDKLQNTTVEEKIKFGIPAGRADVILIGVIILLSTLEVLGIAQITVSTRGVRYGVALELARRSMP